MAESDRAGKPPLQEAVKPYLNSWGPYRLSRDEITETKIRYFCEVVEDGNPVYWDADFAKGTRFGRLIAPPQSLFSMNFPAWWTPDSVQRQTDAEAKALSEATTVEGFEIHRITDEYGYIVNTVAGQEAEYVAPFGPGDGRVKSRSMTVSVSDEKQTRPGKGVFITSVTEYRTEVGDRLIGRSTMTLLKYDGSTPRKD